MNHPPPHRKQAGPQADPGDEPPLVSPPVPSREIDPHGEELSLLNSHYDDEAHVQSLMQMTAPHGERLVPGSISPPRGGYGLEEAEPANENPIVAQLAHDDVDDIAARVTERLERRMTERLKHEVEARMALERAANNQNQLEQAPVTRQVASSDGTPPQPQPNIQTAEEAPELEDDDNFKVCGIRRTCWGLLLITLFLFMVATLLSMYFYYGDNNRPKSPDFKLRPPTVSPTIGPSSEDEWTRILDRIGDTIAMDMDVAVFDDESTTQYKALDWLVFDDAYQAGESWRLSDQELVERYAVAVIYFEGLGRTWNRQSNFLEAVPVCEWNNGLSSKDENSEGVYCSDGTVTFLQLVENGLKGQLPKEINLLTNLNHLNLDGNMLYGNLPSLSQLDLLQVLWMSSNELTGPLPKELPPSLANLDLQDNSFLGAIPVEWQSMTDLFFLGLRLNDLTSLPGEFLLPLSNLRYLDLEGNEIQGTIPTEIGSNTKLESLYLEKNRIQGTIPTELASLTTLSELLLYGNGRLGGTVPQEFSQLTNLKFFWIHGTDISGSIDDIFCVDDFVQSLSADCAGDPVEVSCTCCSQCCNSFGAECRQNIS
ncbi:unnamed protein product [Cylindrotheca closterium]|uniref:L domain-like protein n=1 Tax=Cylindrotheca closterium TaxID=2856 RepID=A0AAD2CIT0_9STRA|nr:unnamed protein product [Cylindrotheca closterium]